MPFKPNYNQQRNERNRVKEQKKQERLARREAESQRRKAEGLPAEPVSNDDETVETENGNG